MTAPTARTRAAALVATVVTGVAAVSLLGSGTSTAAAPAALRLHGPPTTWSPPAAVRWLPEAGPLLGDLGVPVQLTREAGAPHGPAAVGRPAGPAGVVGPGSPPAQVRAVQRLLNARNAPGSNAQGPAVRVDGDWGPATTRAVLRFQASVGLPEDGRAGPLTLAALHAGD